MIKCNFKDHGLLFVSICSEVEAHNAEHIQKSVIRTRYIWAAERCHCLITAIAINQSPDSGVAVVPRGRVMIAMRQPSFVKMNEGSSDNHHE